MLGLWNQRILQPEKSKQKGFGTCSQEMHEEESAEGRIKQMEKVTHSIAPTECSGDRVGEH